MDMTLQANAPVVPVAYAKPFSNGIVHPELWLWDSWCYSENGQAHLYCLALGRRTIAGDLIRPEDRNQYPFHIRHFMSRDDGDTWQDQGVFQSHCSDVKSFYSHSVWSGDVKPISDRQKLVGFTGIRRPDPAHEFLQAIGVGLTDDGHTVHSLQNEALSCPQRDYDEIIAAGYYLGPRDDLGANAGEGGGPILAWRDPFIFVDDDHEIQLFWSAKISPKEGAIAHASLKRNTRGFEIKKLHPPMPLPDGQSITQAEVPKIFYDKQAGDYYLLISACDRLYEGQPDGQVHKTLRLYKSKSLRGPWVTYRHSGSIIMGLDHCFGASVLSADFSKGAIRLICPITEMAKSELQLSISPIKTVSVRS